MKINKKSIDAKNSVLKIKYWKKFVRAKYWKDKVFILCSFLIHKVGTDLALYIGVKQNKIKLISHRYEGRKVMVSVIVGTHGKFSEEILRSAEMIFGKQSNVAAVTFEPGEGTEDLIAKYKKALEEVDTNDGVIIMVDLFGGSPYNAASTIAIENEKMDIMTGVNLPMLLEVFGVREILSMDEIIPIGSNAGKDGIKLFKETLSNSEEEEL